MATYINIQENSNSALVSLFFSFAYIDGELHHEEIEVIRSACFQLGINSDLVDSILESYTIPELDITSACQASMARITDETLRIKALVTLCDIAAADNKFDKNEQQFLALVSEQWDVKVTNQVEEFKWDESQINVVEASSNRRIIVHAGPGMGKTAVACGRVSRLIDSGVAATNIWLLSFTRTAVREIRDRIESFVEDSNSVLGVRVGTIDSRAWRIRCGFSEDEVKTLFGSYDANIQSVRELIQDNPRELGEFFDSLEHVIIDEAQDITGIRAHLIVDMLKLLPPHCGITIFADGAQAIYGWTTEEVDSLEENRVNLLELLNEKFSGQFDQLDLQSIHRTNAPNLIQLIEELRLDIYVNKNINVEKYKKRKELILEKANERLNEFQTGDLLKFQNALFLFRRRAEVLLAASFANSERIQHRIRMSGLPTVVEAWFGQLLSDYIQPTITETDFYERWGALEHNLAATRINAESAWKTMSALGRRNGHVYVDDIRKKLARHPPSDSAIVPDFGSSGPIIGTIHGSKGREADEVILKLPHSQKEEPLLSDGKLDEESRVLFVGASRARSKLYVGHGFLRASFARSLYGGRVFLAKNRSSKSKIPGAQVEIGRENDIDPYSFVGKATHSQTMAGKIQSELARLSSDTPVSLEAIADPQANFAYQLIIDPAGHNLRAGYFNPLLNQDLWKVLNCIERNSSHKFRLPEKIHYIFLMGVSTYAAPDDDPRILEVHEPYASTRMWLVPVVLGYPQLYFPYRKKNRQ